MFGTGAAAPVEQRGTAALELAQGRRRAMTGGMTARSTPTHKAIDSFTQIATLRIELNHSDPPIWRVVEVPTSISLKVLHDIVQVTMGWFDCHLWEMVVDDQTYDLPKDENWSTPLPKTASRIPLRDVIQLGMTRIDYTYDFGTNWEHSLIVSDVRPGDPGASYPRQVRPKRMPAVGSY